MALHATNRQKTKGRGKQHNSEHYLVGLGGTSGFLLLIRVSQVRDLHGLPDFETKKALHP